jgi:hypothetical protein
MPLNLKDTKSHKNLKNVKYPFVDFCALVF